MQITLEWLKDYLQLDESIEQIADILTFSGIEVENIETYGDIPESVVTAKVLESQLMDGSDHLQICQVDTGKEILQVVCGAPNCRHGMIGVLALPGTKLGDFVIKETKIRGTASAGMLCSEKELGLSEEHGGIMVLPNETTLGIPIRKVLHLPDTIFELEITPNRPDLLGIMGIATDLAACKNKVMVKPIIEDFEQWESKTDKVKSFLELQNQEPYLCPRYIARVINNVKIGESPLWLKMRLIKAGLHPINNVVDITNFVMLETGHPLHAFDYDKLHTKDSKHVIIIRKADDKEVFPALDGKSYELNSDDIVIADAERAIALAGVIGGMNSHITENTVNIVLESACFDHKSIRRTSYRYKIQTDSSYRFERQLAPESAEFASLRAAQLIAEIAGGSLCQGYLDDWHNPRPKVVVPIRPNKFKSLIGLHLDKEDICRYLTKLGLVYLGEGCTNKAFQDSESIIPKVVQDEEKSLYFEKNVSTGYKHTEIEIIHEALYFEIPPNRVDLTREADLIEEVIRLHGMDKVEQETAVSLIMDRHGFKIRRKVSDYLVQHGFQEVVNLSFTEPNLIKQLCLDEMDIRQKQIELLNPQNSNLSVMRTSLIPQLLLNVRYNLNHGAKNICLYELNKVFYENDRLPKKESFRLSLVWIGLNQDLHWKNKPYGTDFYQIKGIVDGVLGSMGITQCAYDKNNSGYLVDAEAQNISFNGVVLAEYGKLKPEIASKFDIDVVELKQDLWIIDIDMEKAIEISKSIHVVYQPIPRFPSIERDLSFLIENGVSYSEIKDAIAKTECKILSSFTLVDEYRGKQVPDGLRSLTMRFVFNNPEKTLTDEEVDAAFASILNSIKLHWEIQLR